MTPDKVIYILNQGEYPGYYDEVAAVDCIKNLVKKKTIFEGQESLYLEMINDRDIQIAKLNKEIEQLKSKVQYWKAREK
jgi:hypothetical protein